MPTTEQVTDIVDKVRKRLVELEPQGVFLKVSGKSLDEDGWLYIEVVPSKAGVRAADYARFMGQVERQLRAEGDNQVLLVPALDD